MSTSERREIVILGAGFGGAYAARELARQFPRSEEARITLVDRNTYLLFTPMLTEVVGDQIDDRHVVSAIRRLSPRITFEQGRVENVDLAAKRVTVVVGGNEAGIPERHKTLEADHLVLALGSVTNFHGIPGVEEHALTLKTVGDAAEIRNRALVLLERADAEPDAERRRALLTFVVGGGGYSGVETMAALNDLVRDAAKNYTHVDAADVRAIIVEPTKRLLPELSASLAAYTTSKLRERDVEIIVGKGVTGAGEDYVEVEGRGRIPTHLFIWTAGVTPSPLVETLDCKRGKHGGIVVDACCAVLERPGVWALGDCAEVPNTGKGGKGQTYTMTAQNATREGALVGRNIAAVLRGERPKPFRYTPIGELALVGKRSGVAEVYGLRFSGLIAWAMWRAIYLAKLPLMRNRIRVGLDWILDVALGREIAELPVSRSTLSAGETGS